MNRFFICLLALLSLCACDKEDPIAPDLPAKRTILFYCAGENSLSSFLAEDIEMIKQGMLQTNTDDCNLLVYADTRNRTPRLFQLKPKAESVQEILIESYPANTNSVSAEIMTQIIQQAQTTCPAESYGLVLWSHGTAWLPANHTNYLQVRSFGQDGAEQFMEINDLKKALSPFHFDFLLFDACYMASTEVAYALRNSTDYLIGSPNEVLADGFPYQDLIEAMCADQANVITMAQQFSNYYQDSYGSISVIKTDAMEQLAQNCESIFQGKQEQDLWDIPVEELQIMEHLSSKNVLYDLDDYISHLATPDQYQAFKKSLQEAIIYRQTTPYTYFSYGGGTTIEMRKFSGLSIYVPQQAYPKLNKWYKDLDWYKKVYPSFL